MGSSTIETSFRRAIENIARHGDTDVLPFPIERHVFFDHKEQVLQQLLDLHAKFKDENPLDLYPPENLSALAPVGYSGFRWATQIDPLWNAYLLGLVVELGEAVERERIPRSENSVFSYRFEWDEEKKTLFSVDHGWREFMSHSAKLADDAEFVLIADIADFYQRIYHHRLENSLLQVAGSTGFPQRIAAILMNFSGRRSYGLPVGGPAARILAESLLNTTDKLLRMSGLRFCRFVDDYHLFVDSREEAFRALVFLTEKLLSNEGLTLQKAKTRIMSAAEFKRTTHAKFGFESEAVEEHQARRFLRMRVNYDPYSAMSDEDYEKLKLDLLEFDVFSMLARELEKSQVHSSLVKQIMRAIPHLGDDVAKATARVMVAEDGGVYRNLDALAPVFPQAMIVLSKLMERLSESTQEEVFEAIRHLFSTRSYLVRVEVNASFAVRLLGHRRTIENEMQLVDLFGRGDVGALVRKDIILIMSKWGNYPWLTDVLRTFGSRGGWERRALIVGSFALADEGKHWRRSNRGTLSPLEVLVAEWASSKQGGGWRVPI